MTDRFLQYLCPAGSIPLAGWIIPLIFWGFLIYCRREIGAIKAVVWGIVWIAVLMAAWFYQINPAFYFPVQLLLAIIISMIGWYKVKTGG